MPQDDSAKSEINYVKEAAKLQYNWITLAGITGFALVSGSALPLLLGAGLELMYLSLVPQNSRFQRLVRSWKYAEEKRQYDRRLTDMFQEIPSDMRLPKTPANIGVGIPGMRERLQLLQGRLEIESSQAGTRIRAVVPNRVTT